MLLSLQQVLKPRYDLLHFAGNMTDKQLMNDLPPSVFQIDNEILDYSSSLKSTTSPDLLDLQTSYNTNTNNDTFQYAVNYMAPHGGHGHAFSHLEFSMTESPLMETEDLLTPAFTLTEITWIVLFSIMLSVAVFGNIIVIWIISCHRRMRTVTNYFLLNLSVADGLMATLNGAPNFIYMLRNDWIFGKILCVINNFVANWTVASCVFTMTAISIDRWMAIIKPLEPRMTKSTAGLAIGGIWLGSGFLASPALIFSSIIPDIRNSRTYCIMIWPDNKFPTDSKFELGYNLCLLILTYLIPMTAMAICYGSMSWELWGQTQIGEVTQRQVNSMISKRKIVRMFIVVVATFAICWLPYHSYFIYMHMDKDIVYVKWIQHLYLSFYFLAMSQSSINPIIIIGMNGRFRNYIYNLVFNCRCCHEENIPRNVHYVPATPPLFRRYSQSCSRSRSKSGTGEENPATAKQHNSGTGRSQTNGTRKKNPYTPPGHEVINMNPNKNQDVIINKKSNANLPAMTTRSTYC